jgi:hypothetical protein
MCPAGFLSLDGRHPQLGLVTAESAVGETRQFSLKSLPEAQSRAKSPFIFYYLMRNYWESIGF